MKELGGHGGALHRMSVGCLERCTGVWGILERDSSRRQQRFEGQDRANANSPMLAVLKREDKADTGGTFIASPTHSVTQHSGPHCK